MVKRIAIALGITLGLILLCLVVMERFFGIGITVRR